MLGTLSLLISTLLQDKPKVDLAQLMRDDSCFEMRQAEKDGLLPSGSAGDLYRGYVAARFDRPADAARLLKSYVLDPANKDLDSRGMAYELLVDADQRLGNYKEVGVESQAALDLLGSSISAKRKQDLADSITEAKILADVPPPSATIVPFEITMKKDMAQLNRVSMRIGVTTLDAVLDTGAQLTVLTRSTANLCGIQPLTGSVPVDGITGAKVAAQIAEIPELHFGASTFKHVIVLILDDSALTIGPYKITAILGFPVLEALGRLEFGPHGLLRAGYPSPGPSLENMALKGLGPVVLGNYRNTNLPFTMDTGAVDTHFTKAFADRFLDSTRAEKGTLNLGGAGGMKVFKTYKLRNFEMALGGQVVKLPKADVLAERSSDDIDHFFGNLGQDIFRQYDTMTIDFRQMSFELSNHH